MIRELVGRVLIVNIVLLSVALLFSELLIINSVRDSRIAGRKDMLMDKAQDAAKLILAERGADLDSMALEFKRQSGAEVDIIANNGVLLGTSASGDVHPVAGLDDPELRQARIEGRGHDVRAGRGIESIHVTVRISGYKPVGAAANSPGFVRFSSSLSDINANVNDIRFKVAAAMGLLVILSSAVSVWRAARIRRIVAELIGFSNALSSGELDRRLILEGVGGFNEIAANLNKMAAELRKRTSEHREENERLNAILKGIPDALLIMDSKDNIVLNSAASGDFFGALKIAGRPVSEVVRNPEFFAAMDKAKQLMSTETHELAMDYPSERYLAVKISPFVYKDAKSPGLVAIFHDITESKKLEQVRKDFVANVSHEIKTPVAAIKGFADTLIDGALDDRPNALKFIRIIKSNSERINSLVDDLMTISKIELGVIRVEKSTVNLDDIIENVQANLADRAIKKGLYLNKSVSPDAMNIQADRDRLIQIFTNLVDNAIKFTEKGGVTMGACEVEGRTALFVEDTGIGIPEKHIKRLGERFYRVDPSRSRELGGTGLGLAIVKHLVKAHGWSMSIESAQAKGTRISITI